MKINEKDYNILKIMIKETVEYLTIDKVKKHYQTLEFNKKDLILKDTKIRLMYDLKNIYDIEHNGNFSSYIIGNLYNYLDDTHITSALLKIGYELDLY